jgi:hypothetical protein
MSHTLAAAIAILVCSEDGVMPQPLPTPVKNAALRSSEVLAFGGYANRVRTAVSAAEFAWNVFERRFYEAAEDGLRLRAEHVGVKPLPLSTTVYKPKVKSEVATLQRVYRKLVQHGLHEEAAEIARLIAEPKDAPPANAEIVPAVAVEGGHHERGVRFGRPVVSQTELAKLGPRPSWTSAAKATVSCRFEGDTLEEVAQFFEKATGCEVAVEESPFLTSPRIYFAASSVSAEQALSHIVQSCGWSVAKEAGRVVVKPPAALPLRADRLPILR